VRPKSWAKGTMGWVMARFRRPKERRVVVLCYHSIHPQKAFSSATPELFVRHLEWLKAHCRLIPFSGALEAARNDRGERPSVALTFDDGYADNYEYAFPLLREYDVPATFFVTGGLIECDSEVLERIQTLRGASLEDIRPLTWGQVQEMCRAGMTIGAHTWSHPNLARLTPVESREELRRAKEVLEDRLGQSVRLLAYPFGKPRRHFTPRTMELAAEVGYEMAAAVVFRGVNAVDPALAIPRFFVTRDSVETLAAKVAGAWDWLGWWQERGPLWLARWVSPEDFRV
jgi:peptidoglycan/xylan/chitin deacetylase (PgdA/CDA1 family)